MNATIHIDGGARGNPGPAGVGVVITDDTTGEAVHEAGYFLGRATNNVAEYQGLIKGLGAAATVGVERVRVVSDSLLMVNQVNGKYKVKAANLKPLHREALGLFQRFDRWEMTHTRRENNVRADELANRAMDAGRDV